MADLADRMKATAAKKPEAQSAHRDSAFKSAPKAHPHRVTLDLTEADYDALRRLAFENRVTMANLLRSLVALAVEDEKIAKRVIDRLA